MNILMISPNAPPKNSPESMQVGRYLQELDKHHHITLVTTPVERGWVTKDDSLDITLSKTEILTLTMPFHNINARLLASKYFNRLSNPDKDFWIKFKASWLLKRLRFSPDIIYSRSLPISAALLGHEIKQRLRIPWIMHLSDPWSDNPYFPGHINKHQMTAGEKMCFEAADMIAFTTEGAKHFYNNKYPQLAKKFAVSPNVMPPSLQSPITSVINSDKLLLVYTGALYGQRRPTTIIDALALLRSSNQLAFNRITIQFVGNIADDIRQDINALNLPQISILGRKTYAEILAIQAKADIMISIEPDGDDPLLKTFLPSKMLDYIAARKPIIAITPENSASWKLCNRGYGWAIAPGNGKILAQLLGDILTGRDDRDILYRAPLLSLPPEYSAPVCVKQLTDIMEKLIGIPG